MNTPLSQVKRAWAEAENAANCLNRYLWGPSAGIRISDFAAATSLGGRCDELAGRSVLLATGDQVAAALALIELDGVARRIILCPPDLNADHLHSIMSAGSADALVSDGHSSLAEGIGQIPHIVSDGSILPAQTQPDV